MLGAAFFTLFTTNALGGFAMRLGVVVIVYALRRKASAQRLLFRVVQGKVFGNGNIFGTAFHSILTGGTRNGYSFVNNFNRFLHERSFILIQGLEVLHITGIVKELFVIGHAA